MRAISASETGRLQVMDWAGYGNDGGQAMFASYVKTHPANKPQFSYMTNESDALAKIHAGAKPGSVPAVRRLGEVLRDERARAAVDTVVDLELQAPEPVHGQGGPVRREAVRHPGRLGVRRDPLPHRQGAPEVELVGPHLRRPVQGQDLVVRRPEHAHGRRPVPRIQEPVEPDRRASSRSRRTS